MRYELLIIGGGPGGVAAGIYAARKQISTILVAEAFGGQSIVSADIQNWIGTKSISGFDLAKAFEDHLRAQEGIEIVSGERVVSIEDAGEYFTAQTSGGKAFEAKRLLIASGSRRRKLGVPGEHELDGKGVAYCATCDAPLFRGKAVAVVGGGNAGLEAVLDLISYATKIYLLEWGEHPKGDAVTFEKIAADPKVEVITMAETKEILGEKTVTGLTYADRRTGEARELAVGGVFVEIGAIPNADFVAGMVEVNKIGEIVVDHKTQRTKHPRIWAVGDVSDVLYKQNNISAGDAVKAILNIAEELAKSSSS